MFSRALHLIRSLICCLAGSARARWSKSCAVISIPYIFSKISNFHAWKIDDSFATNKLIETSVILCFGTNILLWREKKVFILPFFLSRWTSSSSHTLRWFSTFLLKHLWKSTHFRIVNYHLRINFCSKSNPESIDAVLWPRATRCCTSEQIRDELRTTTVWWNGFPGCSGTWGWSTHGGQSCLRLTPSQTLH